MDTKTKFERHFKKGAGCWLWTGAMRGNRYGGFRTSAGIRGAHGVAYRLYVAPVPKRLFVLHKCDVPLCVNPKHLWLGTQKDNALDREAKGRGHNRKGVAHGGAKLTEAKVRRIRKDPRPSKLIAASYGLNRAHVSDIKAGRSWGHIPGGKPVGRGKRTDLI